MLPYDIVMLAVLLLTTLLGAWKGMAWQLASLASLVLSYVVAIRFGAQLAPVFGDNAPWNRFIAMLVLYMGTSIAVWMVFRLVAGLIDRIKLKEFDRQLGAVFGAAKGALLCVAITFFVVMLSSRGRAMVLESRSGYYIAILIDKATPVLPEGVHDVLGPYLEKLNEELDPDTPSAPKAAEQLLPTAQAAGDLIGGGDGGEGNSVADRASGISDLLDDVDRLLGESPEQPPESDSSP